MFLTNSSQLPHAGPLPFFSNTSTPFLPLGNSFNSLILHHFQQLHLSPVTATTRQPSNLHKTASQQTCNDPEISTETAHKTTSKQP
ncbi:hypothetical protein NC653_039961 [Populus alba x Populus x berolinensis]|uniref:Uncharacterized protein n=1 Tax=Populus alba x Populus x berolinensis TaxID=444605 RepID=A0AAD6PR30_9ROSI|nr:hypothetical protein NC653_039961 [Populus alba x Populus x berolinensis]